MQDAVQLTWSIPSYTKMREESTRKKCHTSETKIGTFHTLLFWFTMKYLYRQSYIFSLLHGTLFLLFLI